MNDHIHDFCEEEIAGKVQLFSEGKTEKDKICPCRSNLAASAIMEISL